MNRAVIWTRVALAGLLLMAAPACRTRLLVSDITQNDCTDNTIDGIPFRVRETHTVRVFQWHQARTRTTTTKGADGKSHTTVCIAEPGHFTQVMENEVPFPNQRRLFALNIKAEQFTSYALKLAYFPDNTLRKVDIKGTPDSTGVTQLLGSATDTAKKALEVDTSIADAVKKARETKEAADSTAFTNLLDYVGAVDALRRHCENWAIDGPKIVDPAQYATERINREQTAQSLLKAAMLAGVKANVATYTGNPYGLTIEQICTLVKSLG